LYNAVYRDINLLAEYCGLRDIGGLTQGEVCSVLGAKQADAMVLFGGSIMAGVDVFAEAIKNKIAKQYIIVGGAGHTTQALRDRVSQLYPDIATDNKPEAYILNELLKKKHAVSADYLELCSTNCGNNITLLLELLDRQQLECHSVILCQDATMQRRMSATLRKYRPHMKIINYASYAARLDEKLQYTQEIWGMWPFERYLSLLMGEISRLRDDEDGYGPLGKGFIAHEDVPEAVNEAFYRIKACYNNIVRDANPAFAG